MPGAGPAQPCSPGRPRRPGRDAVRREGLGLGALAFDARRRGRIGLSAGALVRHRQGVPVPELAAAGVQRVPPLPAPEGPGGDVALAALPQRRGYRADHRRRHHRRRLPPLQLRGLLSRPGAVRGRLPAPVAQPRLGDAGRGHLCRRQPDGGPRPRLRCRSGEGPARQGDGHVWGRRIRQPHRPVRTGQAAGVRRAGEGSCSGSASSSPRPFTTRSRRPLT